MTHPEDLGGRAQRLSAYVSENEKYDGKPLYTALVDQARKAGCAGATVLRGIEGFGAHSRIHTGKILRLSTDLPVVVEIVDTRDKVEAFLPIIDGAIREGLATLERVEIRFYRSGGTGDD